MLLLPNVVALLSQVTHFQAFASSDALTKGEEKRVTVLCVESFRAVFPLRSCTDPEPTRNHQHRHCAPMKAQLQPHVLLLSDLGEWCMKVTGLAFFMCCKSFLGIFVSLCQGVCAYLLKLIHLVLRDALSCTGPPANSCAWPAGQACCKSEEAEGQALITLVSSDRT